MAIMRSHGVIRKTGSAEHIATPPESLPSVTRAENLAKMGRVVPEICRPTDKRIGAQTDIRGRHNTPLPV